jgi:hypothetical protein
MAFVLILNSYFNMDFMNIDIINTITKNPIIMNTFLLCSVLAMFFTKFKQAAVVWAYFCCSLWFMCFATATVWYRTPKTQEQLPDAGFDIFYYVYTKFVKKALYAHKFLDFLVLVMIYGTLIFVFTQHKRFRILMRYLVLHGTLMLMRSLLLLVTTFPDPYPGCQKIIPGTQTWRNISVQKVWNDAMRMLTNDPNSITCGDACPSGHTFIFILCALTWHSYFPSKKYFNFIKIIVWGIGISGCCLLVLTRMHYTIDILIASYLTITLWYGYHRILKILESNVPYQHVLGIDGLLLYPAIGWLETGKPFSSFISVQ